MEFLRIASFFGSPDPRMCLSGVANNQHCGELLVDASAMIAAVFVTYELLLQKVKKHVLYAYFVFKAGFTDLKNTLFMLN